MGWGCVNVYMSAHSSTLTLASPPTVCELSKLGFSTIAIHEVSLTHVWPSPFDPSSYGGKTWGMGSDRSCEETTWDGGNDKHTFGSQRNRLRWLGIYHLYLLNHLIRPDTGLDTLRTLRIWGAETPSEILHYLKRKITSDWEHGTAKKNQTVPAGDKPMNTFTWSLQAWVSSVPGYTACPICILVFEDL